jgi:hypothetical protein
MSKAKYSQQNQAPQKPAKKNGYGAKKSTPTPIQKERKPYLTIALLIVMLFNIGLTVLLFNEKRLLGASFADVPWYAWMMVLTSIASAVAAIALWYWKKWGLYLYLGSALASAFFMVLGGLLGAGFSALAPAALVGYLISLNWKQFE